MCVEGFDGGSEVTFDLEFAAEGRYHSVQKSRSARVEVVSQRPSTSYTVRLCATNTEFPEERSCSEDLKVSTKGSGGFSVRHHSNIKHLLLCYSISVKVVIAYVYFIEQ